MLALDYSNAVSVVFPYTATERGLVLLEVAGVEGYAYLYVNNIKVDRDGGSYNYGHMMKAFVDVGDVVSLGGGTVSEATARFVPFKGA